MFRDSNITRTIYPLLFIVSLLVRSSRSERSGFEPWPGHCVVFLGKTLYSHAHSASLHPGV